MITRNEVKLALGITDSSKDNLIDFWIPIQETVVREYCQRVFVKDPYEEFTEFFDTSPGQKIFFLKETPVFSISSAKNFDIEIPDDDYEFDGATGRVNFDYGFSKGTRSISITYDGGYEENEVPGGVKEALIRLVSVVVSGIETTGFESEKLGDYGYRKEATNKTFGEMPSEVKRLLDPFKMIKV